MKIIIMYYKLTMRESHKRNEEEKQLMDLRQKKEEIGGKEKQFNHRKDQAKLQQRQVPKKRLTYNILIVEDEPDLVYTYKVILQDEGYNVDTFTDPYAALMHQGCGKSSMFAIRC